MTIDMSDVDLTLTHGNSIVLHLLCHLLLYILQKLVKHSKTL